MKTSIFFNCYFLDFYGIVARIHAHFEKISGVRNLGFHLNNYPTELFFSKNFPISSRNNLVAQKCFMYLQTENCVCN